MTPTPPRVSSQLSKYIVLQYKDKNTQRGHAADLASSDLVTVTVEVGDERHRRETEIV